MELSEVFFSIQGEGPDIGLPTVFVRTARCNLQCNWCDTKYSWEAGEERPVKKVLKEVLAYGIKRVCISGGEPLLQGEEVSKLVEGLEKKGVLVLIETNGSIDLDVVKRGPGTRFALDLKCPSSGMQDRNLFTNVTKLREDDVLKFVIAHQEDYLFARKMLERNQPGCEVVFQPVGGLDVRDLAERVLEDGEFKKGDDTLVLINGCGSTTLMEMFLLYKRLHHILEKKGIKPFKPLVGNYITTQEMAGFSLSLCKAHDEIKRLWAAPADTPYFKVVG